MGITSLIASGLLLGFAGSVHCIGMCGPLMMMLHGNPERKTSIRWMMIHHSGRIISYLLIAMLFYGLGKYSGLFKLQQGASILGGVLLILGWIPSTQKTIHRWTAPFRNKLSLNHISSPLWKNFIWGLFNGTLPCGWVYSAIGASLITGNILHSAVFMIAFGMASTPSLIIIAISGKKISQRLNSQHLKWARWSMIILGFLFLLRGSNLGIPYLSPKLERQKMSCCETH
jgi:uncharacterized protein